MRLLNRRILGQSKGDLKAHSAWSRDKFILRLQNMLPVQFQSVLQVRDFRP